MMMQITNITINTTFDGANAGHFAMTGAADSINFNNSKGLVFYITDAPMTKLPLEGEIRTVDMFVENGGTLTLNNNVTINTGNQFVVWSFDATTGILSQKLAEAQAEILQEVVNNPNVPIIANNAALLQDLTNIAANQGAAATSAAIERLTNSDAIAIATAPVNLATQVISNRAEKISSSLQTLTPIVIADSNEYITGVAAGDKINKYGA